MRAWAQGARSNGAPGFDESPNVSHAIEARELSQLELDGSSERCGSGVEVFALERRTQATSGGYRRRHDALRPGGLGARRNRDDGRLARRLRLRGARAAERESYTINGLMKVHAFKSDGLGYTALFSPPPPVSLAPLEAPALLRCRRCSSRSRE